MGLNPSSEGQGQVNVPIPKPTKESREAVAKVAAKHAEKVRCGAVRCGELCICCGVLLAPTHVPYFGAAVGRVGVLGNQLFSQQYRSGPLVKRGIFETGRLGVMRISERAGALRGEYNTKYCGGNCT